MKRKKRLTRRVPKRNRKGKAKARPRAGRIGRLWAATETRDTTGMPEGIRGLYRPLKRAVTMRIDADVLAWFQRGGKGYQTRINRALRQVMWEEQGR